MEIAFILVFGASYCASFSMGLGLGEECTLGGQTCTLNSSECAPSQFEPDRNVCQCKDGYLVDNGECKTKEGGECSNDSDCVVHALCQEEGGRYFCRCNEEDNIVFNPEDGYCKVLLADKCHSSQDCVKNAHCSPNKCRCINSDFIEQDDHCLPPEGTAGLNDICVDNCVTDHATCDVFSKTCRCEEGYVQDGFLCKNEVGNPCEAKDDCVTNAECSNSSKTCQCENGYTNSDRLCKATVGSSCQCSLECVKYALCDNNICKCKEGFLEDDGQCWMDARGTWKTGDVEGQALALQESRAT